MTSLHRVRRPGIGLALLCVLALGSACNSASTSTITGPAVFPAQADSGQPTSAVTPTAAPGRSTPSPARKPTRSAAPHPSQPATEDPDAIHGTGYSFVPPSGWTDATARFKALNQIIDSAAAHAADAGPTSFAGNVDVVTQSPAQIPSAADLGREIAAELNKIGTQVQTLAPRSIDGRRALVHTVIVRELKHQLQEYSYAVVDRGALVVITFSFSPQSSSAVRSQAIDEVLDSWHWEGTGGAA